MYRFQNGVIGPKTNALPACHQNRLVCPKLLPTDQNGDIGQDVSAAQAVEVEQHITRMASECDAAVCCN